MRNDEGARCHLAPRTRRKDFNTVSTFYLKNDSSFSSRPPDGAGGGSGCELLSFQLGEKGCDTEPFFATTSEALGSPATARFRASLVAW